MSALAVSSKLLFPPEATKIILTLFLSFLIGLEREEHKATVDKYVFGGIRTYPLIGLLGYALALLSSSSLWPVTVGFVVIASFLWLSYWHKLQSPSAVGVTTEISGLTTYVVGALVSFGHFWIAGALAILSVLLLELKLFLEGLSRRIPAQEIFTFTKFLFLTVVILPIVPNENLGPYHINLFKTWLVVVAVSTISYASYLLQKFTAGKGGIIFSALLGGAYSSTVTTVVLSRRARENGQSPRLFSGAILMASGVMYLRLCILIAIFNVQLLSNLLIPLLVLAAIGLLAGWLWSRGKNQPAEPAASFVPRNPLEIWMALLFGGVFVAMIVLTGWALHHLGSGGLFGLAAIMGVSDVDPFVLSLTQSAGSISPVLLAAAAILIASDSNNVAKGFYALGFAGGKTGAQSLSLLLGFAALGLLPLIWILAAAH